MKSLGAAFLFIGLGSLVQGNVKLMEHKKDTKIPCNEFFVDEIQPTFFTSSDMEEEQFYFICQAQTMDNYEYVTLYDTINKIPVYSAYKYKKRTSKEKIYRDTAWKIEPQLSSSLDSRKLPPFMTTEGKSGIDPAIRGENQALNEDYEHSGYDKGHLYPVNHAPDQKAADGTFTLTNAAPQNCMFNKEWYNKVESQVSAILDNRCGGEGYVVTGVIPSEKTFIKKHVNVPSYFWTAFCCPHKISGSFIMSEDKLELEGLSLQDFATRAKTFRNIYKITQPFPSKSCHFK